MDTSSLMVTCREILEMYSRVRRGRMGGIVSGYEYRDEYDTERSKTISEWKREYHRHYYLVSDCYLSLSLTVLRDPQVYS